MDQLIQQITTKTGISDQQAREAVQVVAGFLKEKLPAPIAGQVDGVLGNADAANMAGQAFDTLGGMFGKKE